MTYLELVNSVLRRIREKQVSSVSDTPYSLMIGDILNDVKTEVEDAWDWMVLRGSYIVTTVPNTYTYSLTATQQRTKIIDVWNDTKHYQMRRMSNFQAESWFQHPQGGDPIYFAVNGYTDETGLAIDVWPIPNSIQGLSVNCIVPQPQLVQNTDKLLVPYRPVIEGTLARVIEERGDDGGVASALVAARYASALSDAIALDASLRPEDVTWYPA